jgi:ABC-type protease/lipase transport system fused ATPase/permease subunit
MKVLWDDVRPLLRALAVFSLCLNLLSLVPSLFMLEVFDRVLPSNSPETLLVLLAGTSVALLFWLALDYIRHRVQRWRALQDNDVPTMACAAASSDGTMAERRP